MAPRRRRRPALRILWFWLAWWTLAMAVWLLLTSTMAGSEAIVGVGAAAIAATFSELVRTNVTPMFRPKARWVVRASHLPWLVVSDTALLIAALWGHLARTRPVRGSFRAIPFGQGESDDPTQVARRALAEIGVSLTPNTVAIGIDPSRDVLLVHELVQRPGSVDRLLGREG